MLPLAVHENAVGLVPDLDGGRSIWRVATSRTETLSSSRLDTKARLPSGVKHTSLGWPPTAMSATFRRVAVSTTTTEAAASQVTQSSFPFGVNARFIGFLYVGSWSRLSAEARTGARSSCSALS